jgi:hypothetical protein
VTVVAIEDVLGEIAANAAALDAAPAFPRDAFAALAALPLPETRRDEWARVRAVARADGSVGRLYEGHLNAVERLRLEGIDPEEHWLGVWGADPVAGEGEPARLHGGAVHGVKVFCSGAGGLDRALVMAREDGEPRLVYVELDDVEVDRTWYRAGGMRASESHRVVFHGARVLAQLAPLTRQPWFATDAIRTAAAWAGIADAAADAALRDLAARPELDDLRALAAGRIATARATMDRWLEHAARAEDDELPVASIQLRAAIAQAGAQIIDEGGRATGSRPFATGSPLDRARRDFELFVLQHRLDPLLARLGRETVR